MNCKTSCIIVTYNALRNNWLQKCLDSLTNSSYETDIILVDNASTDGTTKIVKEHYPNTILIESKENLGFAKANNIGIKKAIENDTDYFFLLNQDAWVEPNTIEKLIKSFEKNNEYGIISPIHLNGSGDLLDFAFLNYISNPEDEGRSLYTDLLKNNNLKDIYSVNFINAAAWLLSKECIEKVGFFDDVLFNHYNEDLNYTQRVHFHKMKIGIVPNTFIYHDREERKGQKAKNTFLKDEKKYSFISKYSNILDGDFEEKARQEIKQIGKNLNYFRKRLKFREIKEIIQKQQEYTTLLDLIIKQRNTY